MGNIIYKGRSYAGSVGSNPNLLINGDFQVNQRGQSIYIGNSDGAVYSVDRFKMIADTGSTITKNDDGTITITSSGNMWFLQELEVALKHDSYTISCEVIATSGDVKMWFEGDNDTLYNKRVEVGVNTFTRNCAPKGATFHLPSAESFITLKWVKLEQGSIATPFIPRLYAEELALCQRYYEKIVCKTGTRYYYSATRQTMIADFPRKRVTPNVSIDSFYAYNTSGTAITIANGGVETIEISVITQTYVCFTVNTTSSIGTNATSHIVDLTLDAEIY